MQKLQLKQAIKQKLTPQQIQFINLLQIPNYEMAQKIAKELIDNPVLDKEEEPLQDVAGEDSVETQVCLPTHRYMNRSQRTIDTDILQDQSAAIVSIQEEILKQLHFLTLDEEQSLIAQHLVGSLTERGYLSCSLASIAEAIAISHYKEVSIAAVKDMLTELQKIGPPGIGARNLQECLLLQLKRKKQTKPIQQAIQLLTYHFDDFTKKHYNTIARKLRITLQELQAIINTITQLHPYPISTPSKKGGEDILKPDFIVQNEHNKIMVSLVERKMPRLTIQKEYRRLLQDYKQSTAKNSKAVVKFVQDKINQAKWFIKAIQQRKKTLLNIMKAIVTLQKPFFDTGKERTLRPIFLRTVATHINMDVSTISRAINNKAVQVNGQIYPLKYFFSEPIQTKEGTEVSSRVVKQKITAFIAEENKARPYTDEEITAHLRAEGYLLARRTVTKYRQQLALPIARLRREITL